MSMSLTKFLQVSANHLMNVAYHKSQFVNLCYTTRNVAGVGGGKSNAEERK